MRVTHLIRSSFIVLAALGATSATAHAQCGSPCEGAKLVSAPAKDMGDDKTSAAAKNAPTIVETAVAAGDFDTLVAAVKAAGLVEALSAKGPFTVFAPNDAAFAKLPKETLESLLKPENKAKLASILTFHVVAESLPASKVVDAKYATTLTGQRIAIEAGKSGVTVNGAKVLKTDIMCSNGVIHVIDSVILPASDDLTATAKKAGKFETLLAAAQAAGLAPALQKDEPYTVFAPTDAAFAALPEGTVENLLKPENQQQLQAILKLHIVPGRVYSDQAVKAGKAKTLQGETLSITKEAGSVRVGTAKVVATDVQARNGVIHVIDAVLLPKQ